MVFVGLEDAAEGGELMAEADGEMRVQQAVRDGVIDLFEHPLDAFRDDFALGVEQEGRGGAALDQFERFRLEVRHCSSATPDFSLK